jgi:hypothetical protein
MSGPGRYGECLGALKTMFAMAEANMAALDSATVAIVLNCPMSNSAGTAIAPAVW